MRTLLRAGLIAAGLCGTFPAHAGSWSVQGGYQNLDLDAGEGVTPARHGEFLGVSYWCSPSVALDVNVATAEGVSDSFTLMHTRRFSSLGVGGRKEWTMAPQWSLEASAGADLLRVDRQLVRFDPVIIDPNVGVQGSTIAYYEHRRRNLAPYLGLGVGWHPDPNWTLRLDARRSWTEVGVSCRFGVGSVQCNDDANAGLVSLRIGAEYRFQ